MGWSGVCVCVCARARECVGVWVCGCVSVRFACVLRYTAEAAVFQVRTTGTILQSYYPTILLSDYQQCTSVLFLAAASLRPRH